MLYVLNAFSLNMLPEGSNAILVRDITREEAGLRIVRAYNGGEGVCHAVGHADTAAVMSEQLGIIIEPNRVTVELRPRDTAIVGQCSGPRLPEGETKLPEGAAIRWILVEVE